MTTLVFSDTHLTHTFNQRKYNLLRHIINRADRVIINGDFWDSWFTTEDKFVNSDWRHLFPLISTKKPVYVHGNHDPAHLSPKVIRHLHANSKMTYDISTPSLNFECMHGHQLTKSGYNRAIKLYGQLVGCNPHSLFGKSLHHSLHFIEGLACKLAGHHTLQNSSIAKRNNATMKYYACRKPNYWLITGDSHRPEIDRHRHFANSGYINYGFGSYITITDTNIHLHTEKI